MNRSVVIALASASAMGLVGCGSNDGVANAISSITPTGSGTEVLGTSSITPTGSAELGTASAASANQSARLCTPAACADFAANEISVDQHVPQNTGFIVGGLSVNPMFDNFFRLSLFWVQGGVGGTDGVSLFDFGEDERVSDLPRSVNDYYHLENMETGGETNKVFVYALSGDIDDSSNADNADYLVAGIWLHTPDIADAVVEVVPFADVQGLPILAARIVALTGQASYGAMDDDRREASGYFLNDNNVVEPFFADAVLTANFDVTSPPGAVGAISGEIVNTGDTPFTLVLSEAPIRNANGGPFTGPTVGSSSGDPIDDQWTGMWGGKFFGGNSATATDYPDFVYGTFGAMDGASDASTPPASIVGSFIAREDTTTP